jgi:hypothetical protein
MFLHYLGYPLLFLFSALTESSCQSSDANATFQQPKGTYATKNVIVVIIDGVRYSESWGDTSYTYIPRMASELAPQGVFNPHFYNKGRTLTVPGHVALTTGNYQRIKNDGKEVPDYPSVFHYFRQHTKAPATAAWIIASKDKLEVLARTNSASPAAAFAPATDCGVNGLGTGYRKDTTTIRVTKQILHQYKPKLALINLREPDSRAHRGDWEGYLRAIKQSDSLVAHLWTWIQRHPHYRNTTTLLITNDHGRHPGNRYEDHGDGCDGCRHISLLALGPDIKPGTRSTVPRSQVDVTATIAELLGFPIPVRDGEPMLELFQKGPIAGKKTKPVSKPISEKVP